MPANTVSPTATQTPSAGHATAFSGGRLLSGPVPIFCAFQWMRAGSVVVSTWPAKPAAVHEPGDEQAIPFSGSLGSASEATHDQLTAPPAVLRAARRAL